MAKNTRYCMDAWVLKVANSRGLEMTKRERMIRSYLRWEQRQSQFDTRNRVSITYKGITLRLKRPCGLTEEVKEYLLRVAKLTSEEVDRKFTELLTTGFTVLPGQPCGRGPEDLTSTDTNSELTSTDIN